MGTFELKTKSGKSVILKDENEIQRGGEGRIILMPAKTGQVAKVYHSGIKTIDENRFKLLQSLDKELFITPRELLFQNGFIAGYTMLYAGKEYFPLSALFSQNFIARNGISEDYKRQVSGKIIEGVRMAHDAGFVIGDLNQFNILVNSAGQVKFIDVDSYEMPGYKHSGILLDEIRDYYYQGRVSRNSDYFALSVLLFSMYTYVHPFKGVHLKYKSLAERMINKIPVYLDDPMLKVPKCYQSLKNPDVQLLFNKLYLDGERFLISLNSKTIDLTAKRPLQLTVFSNHQIMVKAIIDNESICNTCFNNEIGYIETEKSFYLYKTYSKGNLTKWAEIDKTMVEQVFVGMSNFIGRKNNTLYVIEKDTLKPITNFNVSSDSVCKQIGHIILVFTRGQIYKIYPDEIRNGSILLKRNEMFTESVSFHSGIVQNISGLKRIFYNTGKDIATVKTNIPIEKVFQNGPLGVVQYIENKQIVNRYFKISGLNFELSDKNPDVFAEFAYSDLGNSNGYVFEPSNEKIIVRRSIDFEIVSEINCDFISQQSVIFYTKSGLIVWDNNRVMIINQVN